MKQYRVSLAPGVEQEIAADFWYIHRDSPANAENWMRGMYAAINSLATMPERCGKIREQAEFDIELRETYFKSHRIIFTVVDDEVRVVHVRHVRHAARQDLRRDDIASK